MSSYTDEDQFDSITNDNYHSIKQYYTELLKQDIQQQQRQQQKAQLSVYNDDNNSNSISTNENELIKDEISNLDFTALQIKSNDNINNHALNILGMTGYLVPNSEKNKKPIKASMKLLRYSDKIDTINSIEEQTNGPIQYDNKERYNNKSCRKQFLLSFSINHWSELVSKELTILRFYNRSHILQPIMKLFFRLIKST